ncbi:hypothetical protein ZWY2020_004866 [Hordeum vulgare]|nr:hypothetical protein ZWY2020_004866 [Hordeum vulgare]
MHPIISYAPPKPTAATNSFLHLPFSWPVHHRIRSSQVAPTSRTTSATPPSISSRLRSYPLRQECDVPRRPDHPPGSHLTRGWSEQGKRMRGGRVRRRPDHPPRSCAGLVLGHGEEAPLRDTGHGYGARQSRRGVGGHAAVGPVRGLRGDVFNYRAELIVRSPQRHQAGIGHAFASPPQGHHPSPPKIAVSSAPTSTTTTTGRLVRHGAVAAQRRRPLLRPEFGSGNLASPYRKYDVECATSSPRSRRQIGAKLYVYDGLYKVECSTHGPQVRRGLPSSSRLRADAPTRILQCAADLTNTLDAKIRPPGYLTMDMSTGKEAVAVPIRNTVDQELSPLEFEYLACPELQAVPKPARRFHKCCIYGKTACAAPGRVKRKRWGDKGRRHTRERAAGGVQVRSCGCPPELPTG